MSLRMLRTNPPLRRPPQQSVEAIAAGMRLIDLREDLDQKLARAMKGHPILLELLSIEDREAFEKGEMSATAVLFRVNTLMERLPFPRAAYDFMVGTGARYGGKFDPQE